MCPLGTSIVCLTCPFSNAISDGLRLSELNAKTFFWSGEKVKLSNDSALVGKAAISSPLLASNNLGRICRLRLRPHTDFDVHHGSGCTRTYDPSGEKMG